MSSHELFSWVVCLNVLAVPLSCAFQLNSTYAQRHINLVFQTEYLLRHKTKKWSCIVEIIQWWANLRVCVGSLVQDACLQHFSMCVQCTWNSKIISIKWIKKGLPTWLTWCAPADFSVILSLPMFSIKLIGLLSPQKLLNVFIKMSNVWITSRVAWLMKWGFGL